MQATRDVGEPRAPGSRTTAQTLTLAIAAAVIISVALYFLVDIGESALGPGERVATTLGAIALLYGLAAFAAPHLKVSQSVEQRGVRRENSLLALSAAWLRINAALSKSLVDGEVEVSGPDLTYFAFRFRTPLEPYDIDVIAGNRVAPEDRALCHLLAQWYTLSLQGQLNVPPAALEGMTSQAEYLAARLETMLTERRR